MKGHRKPRIKITEVLPNKGTTMQTGTIVTTGSAVKAKLQDSYGRSYGLHLSRMIDGDIWVYPRIAGRMRVLSKPSGRIWIPQV
ncbi:MAG: hypothetical protein GX625_21010 [Clostridiaceae bacterium]|nr:hypothetical protein [Clostridiaceae bacterium]